MYTFRMIDNVLNESTSAEYPVYPKYSGGNGSSSSPFLLNDRADFDNLSTFMNRGYLGSYGNYANIYFKVGATIGATINFGTTAFTPIGNSVANEFKGYLDGNNCTISNLKVDRGAGGHGGLFGYFAGFINTSGGNPTDRTLTVTGSVNGSGGYHGGIAGELRDGGIIANCVNKATIGNSSTGDFVGGILGIQHGGKILNCVNNGAVKGVSDVGGIVGRQNAATVTGCYNTGNVSGTGNKIGGIVGNLNDANGVLEHCFNDAVTISGLSFLGGIAGSSQANISYCVNWCTIGASGNTTSTNVGGIAGSIASGKKADHCYSLFGHMINGAANLGGLLGSGDATNSWVLHRQAKNSNLNSIGNDIINLANTSVNAISPAVVTSGVFTEKTWKDILTEDLNGFMFDETIAAKKYFSVTDGSGTFVSPDRFETNPSGDAVPGAETVQVIGGIIAENANDYTLEFKDFALNTPDLVYNAAAKAYTVANALPVGYTSTLVYLSTGSAPLVDNKPLNHGSYRITATAEVGAGADRKILGINIIDFNIDQATLTITPNSGFTNGAIYTYNGTSRGITDFTIAGLYQNPATLLTIKTQTASGTTGTYIATGGWGASGSYSGWTYSGIKAINSITAGVASYALEITLNDTSGNYIIRDGGTDYYTKPYNWSIRRAEIGFTLSPRGSITFTNGMTFVYNGEAQGIASINFTNLFVTPETAALNYSIPGFAASASDIITFSSPAGSAFLNNCGSFAADNLTFNVRESINAADNYKARFTVNDGQKLNYVLKANVATETTAVDSNFTREIYWNINKYDIGTSAARGGSTTLNYVGKSSSDADSFFWMIGSNRQIFDLPVLIYNYGKININDYINTVTYGVGAVADGAAAPAGSNQSGSLIRISFAGGKVITDAAYGGAFDVEIINGDYVDASTHTHVKYVNFKVTAKAGTLNNFTGSVDNLGAFIMDGDLAADGSGSATAYDIGNWANMLRLSQIVNGQDEPWTPVADRSFAGVTFTLHTSMTLSTSVKSSASWSQADIDGIGYGFRPIGKDPANPFKGSFVGGTGTGTAINLSVNYDDMERDGLNYSGLFGYVLGGVFDNFSVEGSVATRNFAGGVAGYAGGGARFSNIINNAKISLDSVNSAVGGIIGGIVGYLEQGKISDCVNNGRIISQIASDSTVLGDFNGFGGIAGQTGSPDQAYRISRNFSTGEVDLAKVRAEIHNCVNTGAIYVPNAKNAGGIVGYARNGSFIHSSRNSAADYNSSGAAVIASIALGGIAGRIYGSAIEHCYNTANVKVDDASSEIMAIIGGISGAMYEGSSVNYSVNTGSVSDGAKTGVGGIVGRMGGAQYSADGSGSPDTYNCEINNCYNLGEVTGNGNTTNITAGGVVGRWFPSSTPQRDKINYSFAILPGKTAQSADLNNGLGNWVAYTSLGTLYPTYVLNGNVTNVPNGWSDILTLKIDGFKFTATPSAGSYLFIEDGESTMPRILSGYGDINTETDSAQITLDYHFRSIANDFPGANYIGASNIVLDIKNIDISNHLIVYDTKGGHSLTEKNENSLFRQGLLYNALNLYYKYDSAFDVSLNWTAWTKNPTDIRLAGTYTAIAEIVSENGSVLGRRKTDAANNANTLALVIEQARIDITGNGTGGRRVWFGYAGLASNTDKRALDGALLSGYNVLNEMTAAGAAPSIIKALVYSAPEYYNAENFKLYYDLPGILSYMLVYGTEYTLTLSDDRSLDGTSVTISGLNNYTGTLTVYFVLLDGDFGKDAGKTGAWGSASNRYLIQNWAHLVRLKEIVSGATAWNSVRGQGAIASGDTSVACSDNSFEGGYFTQIANIGDPNDTSAENAGNLYTEGGVEKTKLSAPYGFAPIGTRAGNTDKPYSGYYSGGLLSGAGSDTAFAAVYYDLSTYMEDDAGLFGYLSGATIESLNIKGRVIGANNVGGAVGYAFASTLDRVTANVIVAATGENVGGVVGFALGGVLNGVQTPSVLSNLTNGKITSADSLTSVAGVNNVGGIVGKSDFANLSLLTNTAAVNGSDNVGGIVGLLTSHNDTSGVYRSGAITDRHVTSGGVSGENYVGGIAGRIDGAEIGVNLPTVSGRIAASGNYLGGAFGYANGTGYTKQYNSAPNANDPNVSFLGAINPTLVPTAASDYVGGLAGKLERAAIHSANWWIGGINISAHNFVGGAVGSLGYNANLSGLYSNGGRISGNEYVGGIIGAVEAGAGALYYGEINAVGYGALYQNGTGVSGASYIGGIIGGAKASAQAPSSGMATDTRIMAVCENGGFVTASGSYAGGIIGAVEDKNVVEFQPASITTGAGTSAESTEIHYTQSGRLDESVMLSGASYVGGIAGYLNAKDNILRKVYSTMTVRATGAGGLAEQYAGGLVGRMDGGLIGDSFSMPPGTVTAATSLVESANNYAGGIIGYMQSGKIENSIAFGFKFDTVSAGKGGVAGFQHAANATVENGWAVYVSASPASGVNAYEIESANKNGKHAIIEAGAANLPDFANVKRIVFNEKTGAADIPSDISFSFTAPSNSGNTPEGMRQLTFYNASGYEQPTGNKLKMAARTGTDAYSFAFDFKSNDYQSFSAFKTTINFTSVANYSDKTAWQNAYVKPNSDSRYSATVTSVDTSVTDNYIISGYITFTETNGTSAIAGRFNNVKYTIGNSASPYIISTLSDWRNFCDTINGANGKTQSTYAGKHVKLVNNLNIGSTFAGNINEGESDGSVSHFFAGTFDGAGHTLTVNYNGPSPRVSVFPNAANATFLNLTIAGSITSTSYDVAGFVGKPDGKITLKNCVNKANISALRLASGFVGYVRSRAPLVIEDCLNTGNITTTETTGTYTNYAYGTGGIVASVDTNTTIESCKNEGNITGGGANVGGIVGRTNSYLILNNCSNSGNIRTTQEDFHIYSSCGGILGRTDGNGYVNMYACYNSGEVRAGSNMAGGLVGLLGNYSPADTNEPDRVTVNAKSIIAYSYNSGNVYSGGYASRGGNTWAPFSNVRLTGTKVGGLLGVAAFCDIFYCYNVGKITSYGCVGYKFSWQVHVGGLIGQSIAQRNQENNDAYQVRIDNCYNAGIIENDEHLNDDSICRYGAGIVGYMDNDTQANNTIVTNTYSFKGQLLKDGNHLDWGSDEGGDGKWIKNGILLDSVSDLTAVYMQGNKTYDGVNTNDFIAPDSTVLNGFGAQSSAQTLIDSDGNYVDDISNNSYKAGTLDGWIYPYGCLPQLAVFALDTKNGLSMHSVAYGENQYGEFVKQESGDEFSPYIIRDGVDLLSLSALTGSSAGGAYWNGSGKYIEFADGANVSDGTVVEYINMTSMTAGQYPDSGGIYPYTYNGTREGKSYHLLRKGALMTDRPAGGDLYTVWKARNYVFDETSNAFKAGYGLDSVNFYPIGMYGGERYFGASVSGLIRNSQNVQVRNLKIDYTDTDSTANVGLFGGTENAVIKNITVCGSVVGRSTSSSKGVYAGGVVGYTGGSTTLENLNAGTDYTSASNKNGANSLSVISKQTNGGTKLSYTGGIVGLASTSRYGLSAGAGSTASIINCVSYADVSGFNSSIGGILGYAEGSLNTSVVVRDCRTLLGTIGTSDSSNTQVGGIAGGRSSGTETVGGAEVSHEVTFSLDGCYVGSQYALTPNSSYYNCNVKIYGANVVGGIMSYASGDSAIRNCNVYGDVYIKKTSAANNAKYYSAFGGIIGVIDGACTVSGATGFYGILDVSNLDNVRNVGGIAGYMGAGANVASGINGIVTNITVKGKLNIGIKACENIGGIAGYANKAVFNGTYIVVCDISATAGSSVGGFIGYNDGQCDILADTGVTISIGSTSGGSKPTLSGSISGQKFVGGFIGNNSVNGIVNIGQDNYGGNAYTGRLGILTYASVDGKQHVGGFIGSNHGRIYGISCSVTNLGMVATGALSGGTAEVDESNTAFVGFIGGIFGSNYEGSTIEFGVKAAFTNQGQVGISKTVNGTVYADESKYQQLVGGIIGSSAGGFTTSAQMTNSGSVFGYKYVGGSIGRLKAGTIGGTYSNGGDVSGVGFVGGVIGVVQLDAKIVTAEFLNEGAVRGVGNGSFNVGGSIGAFYGTIQGSTEATVNFFNTGTVSAGVDSGGIIGLLSGTVDNALFSNQGALSFTGGDGLGGSIGRITSSDTTIAKKTSITNTGFEYLTVTAGVATATTVTATGASTTGKGGVGGVIGTIEAPNSNGIKAPENWANNFFYVNGNVYAPNAENVGGAIGKISNAYVSIYNMLAYRNTITGKDNVGGIVGYNGSLNRQKNENASLYNCFNIEGTVTSTRNQTGSGGKAGGIVGAVESGSQAAYTYACYWVAPFANYALAQSNIDNLGETLTASFQIVYTNNEVINNRPIQIPGHEQFFENGYELDLDWDEYIHRYNTERHPENPLSLNNNGDYGRYVTTNTGYTTGAKDGSTGYYFLYANDAKANAGASEDINIKHNDDETKNLAFWKYIANSYYLGEKVLGSSSETEKQSPIIPNSAGNGNMGLVEQGYIYATAVNGGNNGSYLYMKNTFEDTARINVSYIGDKYYIEANTNTAGNVVIFYKALEIEKEIVYNGLERHAPLKGLNDVRSSAQLKSGDKPGNYFYVLDGDVPGLNYATDVGSEYDVKAKIYFIYQSGATANDLEFNLVGTADSTTAGGASLKWAVTARDLEISGTTQGHNTSYDGSFNTHYISFIVSNIPSADFDLGKYSAAEGVSMKFTGRNGETNLTLSIQNIVTAWPGSVTNTYNKVYRKSDTAGSSFDAGDKLYNRAASSDYKTYGYEYRIYFKDAGNYTAAIQLAAAADGNRNGNYVAKFDAANSVKDGLSLTVNRKDLYVGSKVYLNNGATSNTKNENKYDGGDHGIRLTFTGFVTGESGSTVYADQSGATVYNKQLIEYLNAIAYIRMVISDPASVTDLPKGRGSAAGNSISWISEEIGVYSVLWAASDIGTNYKIAANTDQKAHYWSITKQEATVTWESGWTEGSTKEYSGVKQNWIATVKGDSEVSSLTKAAWDAFTAALKAGSFIDPASAADISVKVESTYAANAVYNATVTFSAKNVLADSAKYTANLKADANSAFVLARDYSRTFGITPASVFISSRTTTSQPYVYDGKHQGFSSFTTNLKANDRAEDNVSVSTSPTTVTVTPGGKTFLLSNAIKAGNYSVTFASKSLNYVWGAGKLTRYSWTIDKKNLTITPDSGYSRGRQYVYTTEHNGLVSATVTGLENNEKARDIIAVSNYALVKGDSSFTFGGTVNVGTYSTILSVPSTSNYTIEYGTTWIASWEIVKKKITLGALSVAPGEIIYDGALHTAEMQITDTDSEGLRVVDNGRGKASYGSDNLSVTILYGLNNTLGACNVGEYAVSADPATFGATGTGGDKTANYEITGAASNETITIIPRTVSVSWNNTTPYVYRNSNVGPTLKSAAFAGITSQNTFNGVTVKGLLTSETLTFELSGELNKNVGNYTAVASYAAISGTNAGGNTIIGNYYFDQTAAEAKAAYSIVPSRVTLSLSAVSDKIYNALNRVNVSASGSYGEITLTYSVSSVNGGANMPVDNIKISSITYDSANAGNDRVVTVGFEQLAADANYELTNTSAVFTNAKILPRGLIIALNMRGNRVYKTFDGSTLYAQLSNLNGSESVNSKPYRMGQGFTVSGFAEAEMSGNVSIRAEFAEADALRSEFDAYVNNVYKVSEGEYAIGRNNFYKTLEFALTGDSAANYTISVENFHDAHTRDPIVIYDSRDTETGHDNLTDKAIQISIEKYSISAQYGNTVQSYANNDNSYNSEWKDVNYYFSGSSVVSGVALEITQGWQYENGVSGVNKIYTQYTRISGSADSALLGAKLIDRTNKGLELNYKLQNQPTLIIGYFVDDGDSFEIGTLAGLLLANYYYNLNFVQVGDTDAPVMEQFTFVTLCTSAQYESNTGIPQLNGTAYPTWAAYIEAFVADHINNHPEETEFDVVFLPEFDNGDGTRGAWGYWQSELVPMVKYVKFKQVADIDCTFTARDIEILGGQFGLDWGVGKANLSNVLNTGAGNAVIIMNSLFEGVFAGTFNGNGYVIENLNIVSAIGAASASAIKVGLFAEIGNGTVTDGTEIIGSVQEVNLRNAVYTVNDYSGAANTIYVGGIAAKFSAFTSLSDVTFTGTVKITAPTSSVFAGGIAGFIADNLTGGAAAIDGAFAAGSLGVSAASSNAGGIAGYLRSGGSLNDVIGMLEVYSEAAGANNIGGIIGIYNGSIENVASVISGASAYVTGTAAKGGASPAFVNQSVGSPAIVSDGISYTALREGSNTGYGAAGYVGTASGGTEKGAYDVITDNSPQTKGDGQMNARRSPRIGDIIDTALLGYGITLVDYVYSVDGKTYKVYQKNAASKLVGTATGTDGDPILLGNVQHVALIRMFRFARFELKNDISMPTGSVGNVFEGAFYGSFVPNAFKIRSGAMESGAEVKMFELELNAVPVAV